MSETQVSKSKNITPISESQTLAISKQQTLSTTLSDAEVLTLALKASPLLSSNQQVITISGFSDSRDHELIALEVAQALASTAPEQRILIIDINFDVPNLHTKANLPCSPGLWDLLTDKCSADDIQSHSGGSGLYILPAGEKQERGAPTSIVRRFNIVIEKLKDSFPTILLTLPDITQSIESELALQLSDSAIIVAREGYASKRDLIDAKTRIEQSNTKLFGVMLSKQAN